MYRSSWIQDKVLLTCFPAGRRSVSHLGENYHCVYIHERWLDMAGFANRRPEVAVCMC